MWPVVTDQPRLRPGRPGTIGGTDTGGRPGTGSGTFTGALGVGSRPRSERDDELDELYEVELGEQDGDDTSPLDVLRFELLLLLLLLLSLL